MLRTLLSIIAICLTLNGCLPLAFVAGATTGVIVFDRRSLSDRLEDQSIRYAVMKKIDNDQNLRENNNIQAAVLNKIVLLVGQTKDKDTKNQAMKLAQQVKQARAVYNQIVIGPMTTAKQSAKDTWITTKIKSELLAYQGLNTTNIKVVTENGTVYLMGKISHEDAKAATELTRNVQGVKKVVKIFEYIH